VKLALIVIIIFLSPEFYCLAQDSQLRQSPVDFFKEQITLTVNDNMSYVNGIYYFRNNTDKTGSLPIAFPFYVDSLSLYPDSIAAFIVDNADTIPINIHRNIRNNSVTLNIPLKSREIAIWHLDYRQRISSSRAVYIITSTASWGKPLEDATYRFNVPIHYKNVEIWPEADTVLQHDSYNEYLSHKTNFMPPHDMEIMWEY